MLDSRARSVPYFGSKIAREAKRLEAKDLRYLASNVIDSKPLILKGLAKLLILLERVGLKNAYCDS